LMERQGFRRHAVVSRSVFSSLGQCVSEAAAGHPKESRAQT
jgi:hypothetical protein